MDGEHAAVWDLQEINKRPYAVDLADAARVANLARPLRL